MKQLSSFSEHLTRLWQIEKTKADTTTPLYELTEDEFVEWLDSLNSDATIGYRCMPNGCPLSIFIEDREGGAPAAVGGDYVTVNGRILRLPEWAPPFQNYIDRKGIFGGRPTVHECLQFFHHWHNSVHGENSEPDRPSSSDDHA